jgi:hypothetical protein
MFLNGQLWPFKKWLMVFYMENTFLTGAFKKGSSLWVGELTEKFLPILSRLHSFLHVISILKECNIPSNVIV